MTKSEERITFGLTTVDGEEVGSVTIRMDQITEIKTGTHFGRTTVSTPIGYFHINDGSRAAEARIHRYMADKIDGDLAGAKRETRIA